MAAKAEHEQEEAEPIDSDTNRGSERAAKPPAGDRVT